MKKFLLLFLTLLLFGLQGSQVCANEYISDDFVERTLKGNASKAKVETVPIYISPDELLSTKNKNLRDGKIVKFSVSEDYMIDYKVIIPKDTPVLGRIEFICKNDVVGRPGEIIISNFVLKNGNKITKLDGSVIKIGANRSHWVAPLGNIILFCPLLLVRGGHAKIKSQDFYPLQYPQI